MRYWHFLKHWPYFLLVVGLVLLGWVVANQGIAAGLLLVALPPIFIFLILGFRRPLIMLYAVVIMSFTIAGLSRYVPGIPFGLSIDGLLVGALVALAFKKGVPFKKDYFTNPYALALMVWMAFTFVEIVNPLAPSLVAWFYANRGLSFYPILISLVTMYTVRREKDVNLFLVIWAVFSLLGTLWGMKQLLLGVTAVEQRWLDAGAASTHVLFGRLRVFSYYSDAAQFGASQAHTSLVFGVIGLYTGKLKWRYLYFFVALTALYAMMISGSRGPLAILAIGGFAYFIMSKNFRIVVLGVAFGLGVFVFLKYTTIMQSNYQVQRMRSALNSDDASLQVRLEREKILEGYMADKPIGGGIGSAGYWGKRFSPGTFLAELGTDGHYTRLWMETGIIGLYLYILMLLVILVYLGTLLWRMPHTRLSQILVAFYCGLTGICVASYTNGLLTQIPTGTLVFAGLAMIYIGAKNEIEPDNTALRTDLESGA